MCANPHGIMRKCHCHKIHSKSFDFCWICFYNEFTREYNWLSLPERDPWERLWSLCTKNSVHIDVLKHLEPSLQDIVPNCFTYGMYKTCCSGAIPKYLYLAVEVSCNLKNSPLLNECKKSALHKQIRLWKGIVTVCVQPVHMVLSHYINSWVEQDFWMNEIITFSTIKHQVLNRR